ncbi:cysteine proteinase [Patellaria atrata CBS 101060]|uniref:Ubiquitin carboxyl-terminal hydrolase n=1 Tax=Patellaria atrata CBS 101060 TaxID=1346257 RepID=A0A9P4VR74_9PEZI|nr:cysteine proteinase [Patellaria atrata CBS 101060]
MMPGPHLPNVPLRHPRRQQSDYHYSYPQPTHSPVHHNQYSQYQHPQYHGAPHTPHYQPWYPPQYQQQQYSIPPHQQYQPMIQHSPMIVSSHPHQAQALPQRIRQHVQTPPVPQPQVPIQAATPQAEPALSVHSVSSQAVESESPPTPTASTHMSTPPPSSSSARASFSTPATPSQPPHFMPVYPPLPWLSVPDKPFPPRASRRRERRRDAPAPSSQGLELPSRAQEEEGETTEEQSESQASTVAAPSELDTPPTSHAPSETDSTDPTTSSSSLPAVQPTRAQPAHGHTRTATIPAVPLIPIKPKAATSLEAQEKPASASSEQGASKGEAAAPVQSVDEKSSALTAPPTASPESEATATATSPPPKAAPKSWADLVRNTSSTKAPSTSSPPSTTLNGSLSTNGVLTTKSDSIGDVLRFFSVESGHKISFLEPRGLVNTGNMCYMNSILQTLVFCVPFYNFLDQVGKRAAHSFKSDTPLLDAMILFMREFNIIDAADSVEKLKLRLKDNELEQYGEAFIPEYVYDVIKRLPRFSTMRRGHQQDAEEFLGFLLEGLHDECAQVMKDISSIANPSELTSPTTERSSSIGTTDGWLEVGPKQKAAITRSSGTIVTESPITRIFGGKLRSELRVPGLKNSVTLEPYQPLQLDIGAPNVNNITDALKGLTHSETLHGDFGSPRGGNVAATKQVFIETVPPVLILHLKRFQYDNQGGVQKIWKHVNYPLDLEIPKEVFPPSKRAGLVNRAALPKYRLIGVVYHHGKNASGGHYTVDVRRQEGREWIRMDDTVIRRVRPDDVAEGGGEEKEVKREVARQHLHDEEVLGDADAEWSTVDGERERAWKGNGRGGKGVVGIGAGKVAYILFYQRV